MKQRRRNKTSINGEFPLPEALIQRIQSFMDGKEAAQTSILSKSWYSAWSTRPNLDFDEGYVPRRENGRRDLDRFWDMTRKTMQRYEELKINIESFRLFIPSLKAGEFFEKNMTTVAEEVIVKAIKMGTKDFEFGNKYYDKNCGLVLPREVFGSKTLIRLVVSGCEIDLGKERKVSCSGLKALSLQYVVIGQDAIGVILSSCPSIENLILQPGDRKSGIYAPNNMYQLYKLKSLTLSCVDIDNSFFSDLSSKFPFLNDLYLDSCGGCTEIELTSRSLECISFTQFGDQLRIICDVPNIRKFIVLGANVPSLSFKTDSREWDSYISLICLFGSAEWFLNFNEFLDCLSLSKITLSLHFFKILDEDMEFQGSGKTVVESLKIYAHSSDSLLLAKCLFKSCRPKIIYEYEESNSDFLQSVCNILIQGVRGSGASAFVVQGLKGVDLELVEESLAERRPLPRKRLLRDLSVSETVQKIRCRLRWQPELSHSSDANM